MPFKRRQRGENSRFLAALARTGNVRLAARSLGVNRSTYFKRRARCPAFAAAWDAALAEAQERLASKSSPAFAGEGDHPQHGGGATGRERHSRSKTLGGEPVIVRLKSGRLQLRRALPGQMTPAAHEAFLRTLAGSANVRLSAAAAGFARTSFYRRRDRWPDFAGAMADALEEGTLRLQSAVFQSFERLAGPQYGETEEEWLERTADCPLPKMTVEDALHLLRLHSRAGLR